MRDAHVTRRDFFESMMVALAATLSAGKQGNAQSSDASKPFIDIHHHFLPPAWMSAYNISRPGPFDNSALTNWSPSRSVDEMDHQSVQTASVSLSTPNVWSADARTAPRRTPIPNDYAAKMFVHHPALIVLV